MDPFRYRYRLSTTGEVLICFSLLLAWGLTIRACLDAGTSSVNGASAVRGALQNSDSFNGKRSWSWEGLSVMTSQRLSASTSVSWGWRGTVKLVIRRHITLDEWESTSPIEVFPFTTIPSDGDVHPHPGPFTPTTQTPTTYPSSSVPPAAQTTAYAASGGTCKPTSVGLRTQESSGLPILRPARLKHDAGTQSSPQAMTSSAARAQPTSGSAAGLDSRTQTTVTSSGEPPGFPDVNISGINTSSDTALNVNSSAIEAPITSTQVPHLRHDGQPTSLVDDVPSSQKSDFGDLAAFADSWDSTLPSVNLTFPAEQSLFPTDIENEKFEQALEDLPSSLHVQNKDSKQEWTQTQNPAFQVGSGSADDDDDAMYGKTLDPKDSSQGKGNVFVDETSGLSVVDVSSVITGESVSGMNERGRSVSSSDLDSMDPLLLGKRKQASQTSLSTTPHPSLGHFTLYDPSLGLSNPTLNKDKRTEDSLSETPVTVQDSKARDRPNSNKDDDKDTNTSEIKGQMSSIFCELRNITQELLSSRKNTQKALDDAKVETRKTQQAINNTQSAVDKLHTVIQTNQDRTQQALHDTHKNIAAIQKQVNQSLLAVQDTKQTLTETTNKVETNTEGIQSNRTDIQANKTDIQQLKDEIAGIREKQNELSEQQNATEDQHDRVDRHMDRQEIINRRNNIVIFGVLEGQGRRRENTEEIVVDVLQTFMPDGDWQPSDVVSAYRAGRRDNSRDDRGRDEDRQARPIIATLDKPSDVGFVLRHRQGRDEMRKQGLNCAQDLSRAQQQKIRDIKSEGKQAYYFKGRLVVKDNPYSRFKNNNRNDRRNTQDNRPDRYNRNDRRDRYNDRSGTRHEARQDFPFRSQFRNRLRTNDRQTEMVQTTYMTQRTGQTTGVDKTVQTNGSLDSTANATTAPSNKPISDHLGQTAQKDQTDQYTTDQHKTADNNQAQRGTTATNSDQVDTGEGESVDGSQSNFTDTSGRSKTYSYGQKDRPRYGRRNPHAQYDFFSRQQQQSHPVTSYDNRRQTSGDRRNVRRGTQQQQQRRAHGQTDPNNYYGSNTVTHGQGGYNTVPPPPPPSFLQAPHLQHLSNMQAAYMPPPPPPPHGPQPFPPTPHQLHPPQFTNNQGGIQELTGAQWQNMWQSGAPARSFAAAQDGMNESGVWQNDMRGRRMRDRLAQGERGASGVVRESRSVSRPRRSQPDVTNPKAFDTGHAQNSAYAVNTQADECVCGCKSIRKKKANKEQGKNYSYIVIEDSDKSQPDTEESEYEECVESVSSSEEEGESEANKKENARCDSECMDKERQNTGPKVESSARPHIPGTYFGTHSLYDSAKVIDITDRVRQEVGKPLRPTEQVLEIQGGRLADKEKVTLPDPLQSATDPFHFAAETASQLERLAIEESCLESFPEQKQSQVSSQSSTDPSGLGQKVTTCAQVHVDAELSNAPVNPDVNTNGSEEPRSSAKVSCDVTSEREGQSPTQPNIADQSLESLARQVHEANERAAARESERAKNSADITMEASDSGVTLSTHKPAKQALLSPTGLLIYQASEESDNSGSKPKHGKPKGKKKKMKSNPKNKKSPTADTKNQESTGEIDGPNTRSKSQQHSN